MKNILIYTIIINFLMIPSLFGAIGLLPEDSGDCYYDSECKVGCHDDQCIANCDHVYESKKKECVEELSGQYERVCLALALKTRDECRIGCPDYVSGRCPN